MYWNATAPSSPRFPELEGDLSVDVAVIGGGIVGVTTARCLKDRGLSVALVEARRVGREVTGKSTAKVTSQHNILYQTLFQKFGEERTRLYAEAQETALHKIRTLIGEHEIDCDLETQPAFTYTQAEQHVSKIEKEVEITRQLGLPASLVQPEQPGGNDGSELPFPFLAAIRFENQAQFHPTKYVAGLAETIPGDGSHVFEHSRVLHWKPDQIETSRGRVTARHVVMATHIPLGQTGAYYTRAYPQAEPVIAARIHRPVPDGMSINVENPKHSFRTHRDPETGAVYGIAAGTSFKPGHTEESRQHFAELETWFQETFAADEIEYRWVNEDYKSMDSAPFIGWSTSIGRDYLIATGFDSWGITNGTAAGMILAQLAEDKDPDHPWLKIFDSKRVKPVAGGAEFVKENTAVGAHLVSGYLSPKPKSFAELQKGQAAVLKIRGKNIAAFRDERGHLHTVSAVCTHMGCILGWNDVDRTWDCPCHGARFQFDGEVIHGPATKPLAPFQPGDEAEGDDVVEEKEAEGHPRN